VRCARWASTSHSRSPSPPRDDANVHLCHDCDQRTSFRHRSRGRGPATLRAGKDAGKIGVSVRLTFRPTATSVRDMAPVRVRGCSGPTLEGVSVWLADASRRRNGPRKATLGRPITVRLRGKSCLPGGSDISRKERRAVVAKSREPLSRRMWGRRPGRPDGCRERRALSITVELRRGAFAWTSSSRDGTPESVTVSAST
jgi:hypothetical protein